MQRDPHPDIPSSTWWKSQTKTSPWKQQQKNNSSSTKNTNKINRGLLIRNNDGNKAVGKHISVCWKNSNYNLKANKTTFQSEVKSLSCVRLFATPWTVAHRLLGPWDSPDKNTGAGCHFLLQGIFPTQGSNLGLLHCRQTLYHLTYQGSPLSKNEGKIKTFPEKQKLKDFLTSRRALKEILKILQAESKWL